MFKFDEIIKLPQKKYDLLTVGELLIDLISENYDDNFQGAVFNKFFGGSPANIAMNTKKLGISSNISAAVGEDGLGRFLLNKLEDTNIPTEYIQQLDYATSLVIVSKSKNNPLPIFYRDADYQLKYTHKIDEITEDSKIVHFSCWPISRNPSRKTVEKIIRKAKCNGTLICFDPNYHPMIWPKGEDGREYVKSIISMVDIIKPSKDDAARLFGEKSDEEHLKMFLNLGSKLVIMTLGKHGAIASNGIETFRFNSYATEVVDATGAGDAFWSGFYAGVVKGYTIKEALKLGFAVSAYKLKYMGAVVELPKLEKIKEIYNL